MKYTAIGTENCTNQQKKCTILRKIKENLLEIRKIVVPLYRVQDRTPRPGPVPGKNNALWHTLSKQITR